MPFLKRLFSHFAMDNNPNSSAFFKKEPPITVVDYTEARNKAIAWLGDRYLLAKPLARIDFERGARVQETANRANLQRA